MTLIERLQQEADALAPECNTNRFKRVRDVYWVRVRELLTDAAEELAHKDEMLASCRESREEYQRSAEIWCQAHEERCAEVVRLKRELDALTARDPQQDQHSKDCNVWRGSSSNPDSEALPCDCGVGDLRLAPQERPRGICECGHAVTEHGDGLNRSTCLMVGCPCQKSRADVMADPPARLPEGQE